MFCFVNYELRNTKSSAHLALYLIIAAYVLCNSYIIQKV